MEAALTFPSLPSPSLLCSADFDLRLIVYVCVCLYGWLTISREWKRERVCCVSTWQTLVLEGTQSQSKRCGEDRFHQGFKLSYTIPNHPKFRLLIELLWFKILDNYPQCYKCSIILAKNPDCWYICVIYKVIVIYREAYFTQSWLSKFTLSFLPFLPQPTIKYTLSCRFQEPN